MLKNDPLLQQMCMVFGHSVRREREHQNITQQQLGSMIGSGHARISDIECGLVPCGFDEIVRLSRALGIDPMRLLPFDECTLEKYPEPQPQHVPFPHFFRS